jgi:hypothetical protein
MSLHIMYDHQCPKCAAYYIPYEQNIVCPNCGLDENEVDDIVPQLVHSANYQKNVYGCYTPIAWWVGSFGDHVALLLFEILDKFNVQKEKEFIEFSREYVDNRKWGNQLYLKEHIRNLSYKVYLEIENKQDN